MAQAQAQTGENREFAKTLKIGLLQYMAGGGDSLWIPHGFPMDSPKDFVFLSKSLAGDGLFYLQQRISTLCRKKTFSLQLPIVLYSRAWLRVLTPIMLKHNIQKHTAAPKTHPICCLCADHHSKTTTKKH